MSQHLPRGKSLLLHNAKRFSSSSLLCPYPKLTIYSPERPSLHTSNLRNSKKRKAREDGQASTSSTTLDASESESESKKKKKKKKKKKEVAQISTEKKVEGSNKNVPSDSKETKKSRVVETVLDTSSKSTKMSTKGEGSTGDGKLKRSKNKVGPIASGERDDLKRFQDSRGSEPRRRTEEGFLIYKEEELGISNGGGDTTLCPFDCDCCF